MECLKSEGRDNRESKSGLSILDGSAVPVLLLSGCNSFPRAGRQQHVVGWHSDGRERNGHGSQSYCSQRGDQRYLFGNYRRAGQLFHHLRPGRHLHHNHGADWLPDIGPKGNLC